MSSKQATANINNSKLSTGPKSSEGKQVVSGNAIQHGILSRKLLLDDERFEDYQALLEDLMAQLAPVGTLEQTLIEKIAIILWRQRRLVKAETATIILGMTDDRIAGVVSDGMGINSYSDRLNGKDLKPPSQSYKEELTWCQDVIAECEKYGDLNLENLEQQAPLLFQQISEEAETDEETIPNFLAQYEEGMEEYVREVIIWCRREQENLKKKIEQYPTINVLVGQAKDKLCIPWGKLDVFNKYQASLDNQLYKAMKALKETQAWRLENLSVEGTLMATDNVETGR